MIAYLLFSHLALSPHPTGQVVVNEKLTSKAVHLRSAENQSLELG